MKKVFLIVQQKDFVSSLEEMRELGVVHVEHHAVPKSDDITAVKDDILLLEKIIRVLENFKTDKEAPEKSAASVFEWRDVAESVLHQTKKIDMLSDNILKRQGIINRFQKWGDFEPHDIAQLKEKGINISLCEIPSSQKIEEKEGVIIEVLSKAGSVKNCMVITRNDVVSDFECVVLPGKSLSHEHDSQEKERKNIARAENELKANTKYLPALRNKLGEKEEKLLFEEVIVGAKNSGDLTLLKGYCPDQACSQIESKAKEQQWGILFEEPAIDDRVPTLLENPKWVNIVKPVFDLIGVVPGYREIDASSIFLVFFCFFVGMLVGDAGYGMLIAAIVGAVHFSKRKSIKDPVIFTLVYILCSTTVLWGVLTGVYFGQQWISPLIPPLAPWLIDEKNVQLLCFFAGAIHLSIAHIRRGMSKLPSVAFLSDVGWVCIVWAMFFMSRMFVLGDTLPGFTNLFFIVGLPLIMLFTNPSKNIFKSISSVMIDLPLDVISSFTDVISYIRLYAVGLATVAVADSANDMSIFWIILLHTVNILLAAMAILVHGVRLNILEFSGHLGMEWTGIKFNPFKKIATR